MTTLLFALAATVLVGFGAALAAFTAVTVWHAINARLHRSEDA